MRHNESKIQEMCVRWFRLSYPTLAPMLFAVPNGGSRNKIEAARLKAEGVTAGVADLLLLHRSEDGQYSSLCIEMKAEKGRQSESQKEWQRRAEENGNCYVLCRTLDEFIVAVRNYLGR